MGFQCSSMSRKTWSVLNNDFINCLFRVIAKVVKTKTRETVPVLEMPVLDSEGGEPSGEAKQSAQKSLEEALKTNQEIERFSSEVAHFKSKIKVANTSSPS